VKLIRDAKIYKEYKVVGKESPKVNSVKVTQIKESDSLKLLKSGRR